MITIGTLLSGVMAFAQFNVTVETATGFGAKDAVLYTLDGSKDMIASRQTFSGNTVKFKMPNKYIGMMKIYFPDNNKSVQFISENKDVQIKLINSGSTIKEITYQDPANTLMEQIQSDQRKNESVFQALVQIKDFYKDNSDFGAALNKEIKRLSGKPVVDAGKNPFVAYYTTNYNKFLVENSAEKAPTTDEMVSFITNSNEYLETSSLLRPLLVQYLNSGTNANVKANVDRLLTSVNLETLRGQTVLSELIEIFDMYGMEDMKSQYLTQASNLKCTINTRLASTLQSNKNVAIGATFPNYKFVNAKNTAATSIHDVKADKKVVVFWSSACSHCEKELPQLLEKYTELKNKNIQIIGLSLDTEQAAYNSRIAAFPWINDSELKGWNSSYSETYNIHATPTYFILDANNKIIAKPDHVGNVLQNLGIK